jgi:hypothetical protein
LTNYWDQFQTNLSLNTKRYLDFSKLPWVPKVGAVYTDGTIYIRVTRIENPDIFYEYIILPSKESYQIDAETFTNRFEPADVVEIAKAKIKLT